MVSLSMRVVCTIGVILLFLGAFGRPESGSPACGPPQDRAGLQYNETSKSRTTAGVATTPVVQNGHNDDDVFFSHLAFARGDEILLSLSSGSCAAWEVPGGRKLFQRGYPDFLCACNGLPSPDGNHMAIFLVSGDVAYVEMLTGRVVRLHRNVFQVNSHVSACAFRSGDTLAFIDFCGRSAVMNVLTGEIIEQREALPDDGSMSAPDGTLFVPDYGWTALDMSQDGRYVLAGRHTVHDQDRKWPSSRCLRVFDIQKGVAVGTFQGKDFGRIGNLPHFSADGKAVVVDGYDREGRGLVALWEFRNHHESVVFRDGPGSTSMAAASFLPDGKTIRIVGANRLVRYQNVDTGKEVSVPFPEDAIRFAQTRSGRYLALGTKKGDIELYASPSYQRVWRRGGWRDCEPTCLDVSPDGGRMAIGVRNRVIVWSVSRACAVGVLDHLDPNRVVAADFSPDGNWLATGTRIDDQTDRKTGKSVASPGKAAVWNMRSEEVDWVLPSKARSIESVRFHPNGRFLLTGGSNRETGGEIALWDLNGKALVRRYGEKTGPFARGAYWHRVNSVSFSPDGRYVLATGDPRTLSFGALLWPIDQGQRALCEFERSGSALGSEVGAATFSPDGANVLFCRPERGQSYLALWSLNIEHSRDPERSAPKLLRSFDTDRLVCDSRALCHHGILSPDGKTVAGCGLPRLDGRLFDAETGRPMRSLRGHSSYITSIVWAPHGGWLATGSKDGSIILWDAATGEQRTTIYLPDGGSDWLAISPDGSYTASDKGRSLIAP